ncbi:hypothetical protein BLJ79_21640 [Arthrobacter sp. UCD-GKA]|uniref:hypothetical protein n=1 Tax=Arthrobacter sp. UCD-GKA TaxID=1913576 RepID=UPI0008DCB1F7|nr:hypothetical protein [Arthrobacter sp. UCD-GKA]OIH81964.1 hypothetical protein BLJ79_21640 [Arthrobacter sp. UCD-GKA]
MIVAVAALVALTGCSASPSEPLTAETSAPASASASPKAEVAAAPSENPNAQIEKQFVEFAETRANAHGISDDPSAKKVVAGLHAFCDEGKPFKVSKSAVFNKNLSYAADKAYCDFLAK